MNRKNIFRRLACVSLLLAASAGAGAQHPVSIVPKPLHLEQTEEQFVLKSGMTIACEEGLKEQAEYLSQMLRQATGWEIKVRPDSRKGNIVLVLDTVANKHSEGYSLSVDKKSIRISGADEAGVFYGLQTLLQLLPEDVYRNRLSDQMKWTVSGVQIVDYPERPWRGMMLDVARYFYDKEFVKKFIDMMAMYKLNKLQFHLIDDSGWRLEIKKYPRLTEVGAWAGPDSRRLGGYYTQDDIREILEYARLRQVEVIPEIEFPAHMLSAVVAYPWLGCTGKQHEVPDQHFISRDLLCVGKESSYQFLKDVLDETVALFPSQYINIGGDEAVYTNWEQCPRCQEVMKREGLSKASELQGYLTNVVADMMKKKNRTVIGWEEIIQRGKLNEQVVALMWHNVGDTIQATRTGHKAILTPATHLYFDFPESRTPGEVKAATWMPPISLEKCYGMEVNDYSPSSTVMGVQGCFWSDQFIHGTVLQEITPLNENRSEQYAEYLIFPRMLALAELAWLPKAERKYADFAERMTLQYAKLDAKGCNYRVPEPKILSMTQEGDSLCFTLAPTVAGAPIRYTTDGSYPTIHSAVYNGPLRVKNKSDFHAMTVVNDRHYSLPIYFAPDYSAYKQYGEFTTEWKPLQVQTSPSKWRFECTGKISGNGEYEIAFIQTGGQNVLKLGNLSLLKRDEKLAEISINRSSQCGNPILGSLKVDAFEAGTPFYIEVEANGINGNDTRGLVFIRKK
ncbi:family 20 glycosylhydrolase [Bacteroides eggerthii]|uniref:beta-N-acetylhexosaminidase n=2 Tax=Bacteroidales TaxID=171549 RepID=A0ABT7U548_9BACE|nr:family 20 glycosylhydrolase [Bacteroides eggerthii]